VDCHCIGMADMTPDKGVFKRKGSDVWQHRVFIPKDVRSHYGGKSELPAKSLGTRDLKEANRLARQKLGRYEAEFDDKRVPSNTSAAAANSTNGWTGQKPLTGSAADHLIARYRQALVDRDLASPRPTADAANAPASRAVVAYVLERATDGFRPFLERVIRGGVSTATR
jgi:hypothetical protein